MAGLATASFTARGSWHAAWLGQTDRDAVRLAGRTMTEGHGQLLPRSNVEGVGEEPERAAPVAVRLHRIRVGRQADTGGEIGLEVDEDPVEDAGSLHLHLCP